MKSMSNSSTSKPKLSIVIPAFNEEGNLKELYGELFHSLSKIEMSWEIIIADDGSKDSTWNEIKSLHKLDKRVRGIRLSRNFGHQYALLAGLSCAVGEAVISMDADLQHPPQIVKKLVEEWRNGKKIVNTIRIDNKNISTFKKYSSKIYYKIFSLLSGVKFEIGMADLRLLDREVLDNILKFSEAGVFLRGIVQWVGYPSSNVKYQCRDRFSGETKYNLRKMLKFAWTGISSFSIVPLRLGIIVGMITSLISFVLMGHAVYAKVVMDATVPGWATTITVISFMFGILFILIGLIGEYIGRILIEVRHRPRFVVRDKVGIRNEGKIKDLI